MAARIIMPMMGMTMKTGTVGKWLKNEGDKIKKGDALVEIMTEKITNKIVSRADGVLLKIVAPRGTELPVGALMGVIGAPGEDITAILAAAVAAGPKPAKAAIVKAASRPALSSTPGKPAKRINISPVARKLAEESGIDYTRIVGTGPEGRITREDVQKTVEAGAGVE